METPRDSRMVALVNLYDWQTTFFKNVLDGISDADAHKRLDTPANHIAWLAGSLVGQRYELVNELTGSSHKQQADELFKGNQGIKEGVAYPSLEQYRADWEKVSPIAREALLNATTEKLDSILKMPGMEMPLYDYVLFTIYREANCIGQIALWRRLLGYEAMKYM
ncbi:DinB family protein [Flavobacterium sp.]|uniref:DinB family protein n=1 Tax=Flavobacterium sp. TaxID=239 RepID=UPI0040346AE5